MSQINLKNFPGAIDALHETQQYFTGAHEVRNPEAPAAEVVIDPAERTPDGMIELGLEHLQLQRALHLDYDHAAKDLPRAELEAQSAEHFMAINAMRKDPIDISTVHEQMLRRLAEPNWLKASAEELAAQPDYIQEQALALQEIDAKLAILSQDEPLREAAHEQYRGKTELTKTALTIIGVEDKREALALQISEVYQRAGQSGRPLNTADQKRIARLEQHLAELSPDAALAKLDPARLPELTGELNRLVRKANRRELENGLLRTPHMQEVIDKVVPSLVQGRPALFVGETGGAKTALAEAIARQFIGKTPELVSFHGEINVYQLMGKDRIEGGDMAFSYGPAVRAMESGAPLILDEVNAAPADFLKRLNVIMQLRPGDVFTVQEDSGKQVRVKPGFCVIATANEKSARYKGVDVMSAELKNRFGANVYRIGYPDSEVLFGQLPPDNLALAEATLADDIGEFAVELPAGQLEAFVKAAHASQKIFSGIYDDGRAGENLRAFVPQDRLADNKPGLEDTVLSPRMMVAILQQVKDGMGRVDLTEVLQTWVRGIEKPTDRAVIHQLLDSHMSSDKTTLLGNRSGDQ